MEIQEISSLDALLFSEQSAESPAQETGEGTPLTEDLWSFGPCWGQVKSTYVTYENLYHAILDQKEKIHQILEQSRSQAVVLTPCQLELISQGICGSYFLFDEQGIPQYVIKPIDEDAGCLNNPKVHRSPFDMSPIRSHIPLYGVPFREVAAYQIACLVGVSGVAPKTILAILQSESFSDFSELLSPEVRREYLAKVGETPKEKLCSAQEFIPNSKMLFTALQELQALGLSDEEIALRFDPTDFEDANILIWCTQDTDAHAGNFLCYPKGVDLLGNEILGIKKIDHGLAFPEKNGQLKNHLMNLPNAKLPLSASACAKIEAIDIDAISAQLAAHRLEGSVEAFRERMAYLKQWVQDPAITIQDINRKMRKI